MRVVRLARTTSACPTQWEGETADGRQVHARFRWGTLRVWVGDGWPASAPAIERTEPGDEAGEAGWSGFMEDARLLSILREVGWDVPDAIEEGVGQA